jgi:hypothetical protein
VCKRCYKRSCDDCMTTIFCEHDDCDIRLCASCNFSGGGEPLLDDCDTCFRFLCFKHRYEECKAKGINGCLGCLDKLYIMRSANRTLSLAGLTALQMHPK